jgi:hypothetical protein
MRRAREEKGRKRRGRDRELGRDEVVPTTSDPKQGSEDRRRK